MSSHDLIVCKSVIHTKKSTMHVNLYKSLYAALAVALLLVVFSPISRAQYLYPTPVFEVGLHPASIAVGDIDGDGSPDMVTANQYSQTLSVLRNNGVGVFG